MQRTGRKGHAQFRLIVQESRRSPKSGNIVFALGSYDPHSKQIQVDKEKASFYLEHGAQPSPRVAILLQKEGVKMPKWVEIEQTKKRTIKNSTKLRRNRPADEKPADESVTELANAVTTDEKKPAESDTEAQAPEETAAETTVEVPKETTKEASEETA
ncbi:30S ribosomal protein S16 [Candidatus Saccharibacteria bacterium]|nr:30S ribosomal protein S16 [Candidatus Saccharibacteria bacterium]